MANDTIQPALSPEEWARWNNQGYAEMAVASAANWMGLPVATPVSEMNASMVAIALASLPDGHPLKITREMVKAMALVYTVAYASREYVDREVFGLASRLITTLNAMLPPDA